jgi:hypothetical protein
MSKFITGKELEDAVYNTIWDAQNTLLIVSPFIKLDSYFRKLFDKHINSPNLHIIIVFGKNEGHVDKSMKKEDFDYFKNFMNVSIIYQSNLHGKYYGNESQSVVTSINLHDYSFKNNIEFGVYQETKFLDNLTTSLDRKAWETCNELAQNGDVVFIKRPVYEKKIFSALLGKNYIKSDILLDNTEYYYNSTFNKSKKTNQKLSGFPNYVELGSSPSNRPERSEVETKQYNASTKSNAQTGFCIRTGKSIQFNPHAPYCYEAYQSWAAWGNPDFPEKYCHKTGKLSNGRTSKKQPILFYI